MGGEGEGYVTVRLAHVCACTHALAFVCNRVLACACVHASRTAFDAVGLVAIVLAYLPACGHLHDALLACPQLPLVLANGGSPVCSQYSAATRGRT